MEASGDGGTREEEVAFSHRTENAEFSASRASICTRSPPLGRPKGGVGQTDRHRQASRSTFGARRSPCGRGTRTPADFSAGSPRKVAGHPRRARETWTAGSAAGFVAPAPGPAPAHEGTGLARGLPAAARRLNFKLKFNLAWSAAPANGPPLSATSRRGSRGRPRRVLPWTAGSFPSPAGPRPRPSAGSAGSGPAGPPSRRGSCTPPFWQMAEVRSNRVYFVSPAAKISSKALRHMVPLCVNDRCRHSVLSCS